MNMSRSQWLSPFFRLGIGTGAHKPAKPGRGKAGEPPLIPWRVVGAGKALIVHACTRGEARAIAKRELGIKGRLPRGVTVERADAKEAA